MHYSKRRSGFTLVELLVVMIIISMLVGLTIPAVMMARERARRMTCANNLQNLGKALQEYELAKKQYPGWVNKLGNGTGNLAASWPVMILKNIDRADIYDIWRDGGAVDSSQVSIDTFVCPSAGLKNQKFPLSYVANCGQQDAGFGTPPIPPDWAANGVFFRLYSYPAASFVPIKMASTDIVDGLQFTLLLSENLQAGNWANIDPSNGTRSDGEECERLNGMVWWFRSGASLASETVVKENLQINAHLLEADRTTFMGATGDYTQSRPSSYHPGGVNAVFCGGNGQFLDEKIEYRVYAKLMATNDAEVMYAGEKNYINPKDIRDLLSGKISEEDLK